MDYLKTAIMAIIQGLTEFLPVSSSGHLVLAGNLLNFRLDDMLSLAVMLHMGTLIAVLIIFWRDWLDMLRHPVKNPTLRLLFIASLPALVIALILNDTIDSFFSGWLLGPSFLITALFLCLIERISRRGQSEPADQPVTARHALLMGLFQGVALLPGISRSGSTMLGGVAGGLNRRQAAKFSFMMSAPAIGASFLLEGKKAIDAGQGSALFAPATLLGMALAAVSGYLAIRYMLKLIERISFYKFALYVALVGLAFIVLQLTGTAGLPLLKLPQASPIPLG